MSGQCEHHECKCAKAAELAAMGRTAEAVDVHTPGQRVTCRQPEYEVATAPSGAAPALLLELLRAVADVLNASSFAAEALAVERMREAARVTLDDGSTLLESTIEAAEHAAGEAAEHAAGAGKDGAS